MIRVGVIGYGYWGPNLVRNFSETPGIEAAAVSDLNPARLAQAKRRYPALSATTDYRDMLRDPAIDAIAISTPVSTHFPLALEALEAGKHVWVEKPLTTTSAESERLIEEAERRRLTLIVDHTFVYTSAVRKIRELVASGSLGDIYYYDSVRVNLGLFQHDVDVIWDLAVHDLSIMDFVLGAAPSAVSATGMSHVEGGRENIAYITAFFPGGIIGHVNVNWLAPVKLRRTLIGGSRQMIVYDDMEAAEKVKIYDKGITLNAQNPDSLYQAMVGYRLGDMWAPKLDVSEALRVEAEHFAAAIESGQEPITGGRAGLRVVRILEAATRSMKDRGRLIELPS